MSGGLNMFDGGSSFNISKTSLITIVEKIISEKDETMLYKSENNFIKKVLPIKGKSGVRIDIKNDVLEIFVPILMKKGTDVAKVSEELQNSIKCSVQEMTNAVVNKVNIKLVDLIA